MKYLIRIAFSGGAFYGTQRQKNHPTIQGVFEEKLSRIYNTPVAVTISSRLDRFVSALDFAMTFETDNTEITPSHLCYYLERCFSDDVVVKEVVPVPEEFSPRYDCRYKTYCYLIQNTERKNPILSSLSYAPKGVLEVSKMREALSLFQGEHDFRHFSTPEGGENTHLILDKSSLCEKDGMLYLRFQSKAFLRYQVRFMVGAALLYAENKVTLATLSSFLEGKESRYIKYKAEGKGLYLERIFYPLLDQSKNEEEFPSVFFKNTEKTDII